MHDGEEREGGGCSTDKPLLFVSLGPYVRPTSHILLLGQGLRIWACSRHSSQGPTDATRKGSSSLGHLRTPYPVPSPEPLTSWDLPRLALSSSGSSASGWSPRSFSWELWAPKHIASDSITKRLG